MMVTWPVPAAAQRVTDQWNLLAATPVRDASFDPSRTDDLPEPVQRWLRHSLAPGVHMACAARLMMHGEILIGSWRPFRATQIIVPGSGFIWAATTTRFGLPIAGYDRYSTPSLGQMSWRIAGVLPVVTAAGPDIARSAAGRLAAESIFVPTSYSGAEWSIDADRPDDATATWHLDEFSDSTTLHLGPDGRLNAISMKRWGKPEGHKRFAYHNFTATIHSESSFEGITIPTSFSAGWSTPPGSADEFLRATITSTAFR